MNSLKDLLRGAVVMILLGASSPALAATIYGSLTRDGQPLRNVGVKLTCGGSQSAGRTDEQGNYSLSIAASGSCSLSVDGKAANVILGKEAARYDFVVPAAGTSLQQL